MFDILPQKNYACIREPVESDRRPVTTQNKKFQPIIIIIIIITDMYLFPNFWH